MGDFFNKIRNNLILWFIFPNLGGNFNMNIQRCWFLCINILFNIIIILLLEFHLYYFCVLRRFKRHNADFFNKIRINLDL